MAKRLEITIVKTHDLGHDWFANQWSNGSMTIRSIERHQRINLPVESVNTLRDIFKSVEA